MKWIPYEGCQISENRHVLKAVSVDQLPEKMKFSFPEGFTNQAYLANIECKALYSDPYETDNCYNVKNEVTGITFNSGQYCETTTIINFKDLKPFLQKTSTFYLGSSNCPILIKNKNYVVLVCPCNIGKLIRYIPK